MSIKRLLVAGTAATFVLSVLVNAEETKPEDTTPAPEDKTPKETEKKSKEIEDVKKKAEKVAYYKKYMHQVQLKLNGFYLDERPTTNIERAMPFVAYLPVGFFYLLGMIYAAYGIIKRMYRYLFRNNDPTKEECERTDKKSITDITFTEIVELNQKREENRLTYGDLIYVFYMLNQRTEFEPDDTFSQKTAVWVHTYKLMNTGDNYEHEGGEELQQSQHSRMNVNDEDNEDENYKLMKTDVKSEFTRAKNLRNSLQMMCILSIITSGLALSQIFGYLVTGDRVIILCSAEKALLRLCFVGVILLIGIRDLQQIAINLFVRISGAMQTPEKSRFVMFEFLMRTCITLLAMLTILVVIFTSPKDGDENAIDQTMNFTALVILLEIDNILGGLLQKKIDLYEVSFEYDPQTIEFEFNRAADFIQARSKLFWFQSKVEGFIVGVLTLSLYVVFSIIPLGIIFMYISIPPKDFILPPSA